MGKGDKKSRRGKITIKSYGVRRPRKNKGLPLPEKIVKEVAPVKKPKEKPVAKPVEEPVTVQEEAPVPELTGETEKTSKKKTGKPKSTVKKEEKTE